MNRRYTLTEANQLLQLVRVIAQELCTRRSERRRLDRERRRLEAAVTPLTLHIPGRSLPVKGRRNSLSTAEVVFCWQEGESSVCFGHPPGEEEHQRRPLRVAKGA